MKGFNLAIALLTPFGFTWGDNFFGYSRIYVKQVRCINCGCKMKEWPVCDRCGWDNRETPGKKGKGQ